jgi:hypothetical protein
MRGIDGRDGEKSISREMKEAGGEGARRACAALTWQGGATSRFHLVSFAGRIFIVYYVITSNEIGQLI